jgi:hypothetical protein
MAQDNNISKDLYDLLVTRNFDPEVTDEQGQASQPDEGAVFSFDYVSGTGRNYGTAVAVITQDQELMLFFGDNLGRSMEEPDKTEWFDFLAQLKNFATRNDFHTFAPRNLNQLRHTMAGMAAVKEGLFEGYYGTRRVSYMGEEQDARLMIRHRQPLGDSDARYRNIDSLFIETVEGERFRLPFTHLAGGRAMLEHVRQGGRPYDVRGVHITEMVTELKVLSRFRRANAGRVLEGATQPLVEAAEHYHAEIKSNLTRLATSRGYQAYFESWQPMVDSDSQGLVEDIRQLFVEQHIDSRIEAALPILARIKDTNMREAEQFETWANQLVEGTWALPDTPEAQSRLKTLMSKPLELGPDAMNATQQLYDVVGDDKLYDIMQQAAQGDPDANVWDLPEVRTRMEELGVSMGELPQGTVGTQEPEQAQAPVSEADNLATFQEGGCNHTMEGESCPVHGLAECGMHEDAFDDALADYLKKGGKIQQEPGRMPRLGTRLRQHGSRHIGQGREPRAGQLSGRGANVAQGGKPVVAAESLRDGEYHIATVTLDDGTTQKVRITADEGFRDQIKQHFARQGRRVLDIDVNYAVRADEDSTDPMDRRGGVWDSFYEAQESNAMAQAVTRRIVNQHPEWITRYGVEFLMQAIDDVTEGESDWEEIGSSDVSAYVDMVHDRLQDRGSSREEMQDRKPFAEQGVAEMDSQGYRGHRGDEDPGKGPEKLVKPAKAKDVAKDAEKILTKAMDRAQKKQGVEEVSGDNKPRFTGVPARDPNPPEIRNTQLLPPAPGRPTFVGKPEHLQSPDPLERLKNLALAKTR